MGILGNLAVQPPTSLAEDVFSTAVDINCKKILIEEVRGLFKEDFHKSYEELSSKLASVGPETLAFVASNCHKDTIYQEAYTVVTELLNIMPRNFELKLIKLGIQMAPGALDPNGLVQKLFETARTIGGDLAAGRVVSGFLLSAKNDPKFSMKISVVEPRLSTA